MDKYLEIRKPQIQPRAWTLDDEEKYEAEPSAFEGVMTRQMLYPDARVVHRRVAALRAGGLYRTALEKPSRPRPVDFLWQDIGGERHIFFSSLDELTIRLNLDATRVPGVTPGEGPTQSEEGANGTGAKDQRRTGNGQNRAEKKSDIDRRGAKAGRTEIPDPDTGELMPENPDEDDDLEVNVEVLLRDSYVPPSHHDRLDSSRQKDVSQRETNVERSTVLKRQEVSSQFGKLNAVLHAMLDESAKAVEDVDAIALNDGLESMWRATIDRMESDETKKLVRRHAALVMDPVGEG